MKKRKITTLMILVCLSFVLSAGLVFFAKPGAAQVTTRWNLCRVLGAGYDGCGLDVTGVDDITATGTVTAGSFVGDGSGLTGISGLLAEHVVYVANNGNDATGNGSEFNPVKTLSAALALIPASTDGLIVVGHGTFSADGLVFDDISLTGAAGSTILSGSFEMRGSSEFSLVTLTGVISAYEDTAFQRVYLANGRLAIKSGAAFRAQRVYTLAADAGYVPITVEAGGSLSLNFSEIKTAAGIAPVSSAGSLEISNSSVEVATGTEGGNSLSISSTGGYVKLSNVYVYGARHTGINVENGATSASPNVLNNVASDKDIVAGTAYTYYDGIVFTAAASLTGSELHNTYFEDFEVTDDLIAGGDVVATGTVSAASMELSGNATAAYFIGNGSLLTGLSGGTLQAVTDAGKTTTNDITVAGIQNNGTLTVGATGGSTGYDILFWTSSGSALDGKMFWDSSKNSFRAGAINGAQWDDANTGVNSHSLGYNNATSGTGSLAFGYDNTASNTYSQTYGSNLTSSAFGAMVIGRGRDSANKIVNNIANSLMIGMDSTIPAIYVAPGGGVGTDQQVGFGTTSPLAGSLVDVDGVLNSASITAETTIFATGTISSVGGYIANGSTGIDFTTDVCCTFDVDMTCTATGTVTFTKGILTAETCP